MTTPVESFIHSENIKNFKKRLGGTADEAQRKILLMLLAKEEEAVMASRLRLQTPHPDC